MKKLQYLMLLILAFGTVLTVSANETQYLQKRQDLVRVKPGFGQKKLYELYYGQPVQVKKNSGSFALVSRTGQKDGWIRSASLTTRGDLVKDPKGKVISNPTKQESLNAANGWDQAHIEYFKDKSQLQNELKFLDAVVEPAGSPYSVDPLKVDAFMKQGGLRGGVN